MQDSEEYDVRGPKKGKYHKTTMKKKQQLIDLVQSHNYTVYKASKKLKISNSTAQAVVDNYHKHGEIFERNSKTKISKVVHSETSPSDQLQRKTEENQRRIEKKSLLPQKKADEQKFITNQSVEIPIPMRFFPFPYYYFEGVNSFIPTQFP